MLHLQCGGGQPAARAVCGREALHSHSQAVQSAVWMQVRTMGNVWTPCCISPPPVHAPTTVHQLTTTSMYATMGADSCISKRSSSVGSLISSTCSARKRRKTGQL